MDVSDVIGGTTDDSPFFDHSQGHTIIGQLEALHTATTVDEGDRSIASLMGSTKSKDYFNNSAKGNSNVISKLENLNTRLEATYNKTEVDSELDLIDGAITNLNVGLKDTYRKSEVDGALGDRETSTFTDQEEVINSLTNEVITARTVRSITDVIGAPQTDGFFTNTDSIVGKLETLNTSLGDTYKKSDVYTKTEVDANHYTKTEVDANHYTKTEVDANHYTKTEVDANHYTKTGGGCQSLHENGGRRCSWGPGNLNLHGSRRGHRRRDQ